MYLKGVFVKKILIIISVLALFVSCGKKSNIDNSDENSLGSNIIVGKEMGPREFAGYIRESNLKDIETTSEIELSFNDDTGTFHLLVYEDAHPLMEKGRFYTVLNINFKKIKFINDKDVVISDLEIYINGVYGYTNGLGEFVARKVKENLSSIFYNKNEIRLRLIDLNFGTFKTLSFGDLNRSSFNFNKY